MFTMSVESQHPQAPQSPAGASTPLESIPTLAQNALDKLERSDRREHRVRATAAGLFLASGALAIAAVASGEASDIRFSKPMPYIETAQRAVNNSENVLEGVGIAAFIAGLSSVALIKAGARKDVRLQVIDQWSSRDMSEDRLNPNRSLGKRALEATFAGRVPVMASIGAGLAVFSTAISTEVSDGPQRPIEKALATLTPGETMVVNYDGVMPMVESAVSRELADAVVEEARDRGMQASILDLNLGVLTKGEQNLSDLSLGVQVPENSPLYWGGSTNCQSIPIAVDETAGLAIGENVKLNGVNATVMQEVEGISATNRVGILMDQQAMATCLRGNEAAPVHSIVVNGSTEQVQDILNDVNAEGQTAAVISVDKYLDNSQKFWESNVKPITSVLALFAGVFASAVAGSRMRESLIRNRREWAAKLANANSQAMIRATEYTRVTKDGILASIVGGGAAMVSTPFIVNTLESGFQASVGLKELAVGAAVAIGGSIAGATRSLINPKKIIRPEESLRS